MSCDIRASLRKEISDFCTEEGGDKTCYDESHAQVCCFSPFMSKKAKKKKKNSKKTTNNENEAVLETHIITQVKYLIGAADQFKDVDLWMWFSIVSK